MITEFYFEIPFAARPEWSSFLSAAAGKKSGNGGRKKLPKLLRLFYKSNLIPWAKGKLSV